MREIYMKKLKELDNNLLNKSFLKGDIEIKAHNNFMELIDWIKVNNKRPSASSKEPEEKRLGIFCRRLRAIKHNTRSGIWYPFFDELSERHGMEMMWDTPEIKARRFFIELVTWCKENKKTPNQRSSDENEQRLANFLLDLKNVKNNNKTRKKHHRKWYPFYTTYLKKHKAEYIFETVDYEEVARVKFIELLEWIKENGRKPSRYSIHDLDEVRLANLYIEYQRSLVQQNNPKCKRSKIYPFHKKLVDMYKLRSIFK